MASQVPGGIYFLLFANLFLCVILAVGIGIGLSYMERSERRAKAVFYEVVELIGESQSLEDGEMDDLRKRLYVD